MDLFNSTQDKHKQQNIKELQKYFTKFAKWVVSGIMHPAPFDFFPEYMQIGSEMQVGLLVPMDKESDSLHSSKEHILYQRLLSLEENNKNRYMYYVKVGSLHLFVRFSDEECNSNPRRIHSDTWINSTGCMKLENNDRVQLGNQMVGGVGGLKDPNIYTVQLN